MTPYSLPLGGLRRSALALASLTSTISASTTAELEPIIVSALRMPQPSSTVTSAVTPLDPAALGDQGLRELREALNQSPGVIATSTSGQTGASSSLFIRGTTTAESLLVLDGIRMNGAGNQLGNIFAAGRSQSLGALEVLRGPQAAIYGGESIGGVVWMETPRGQGEPSAMLSFEAGSFNSLATFGEFQGETDDLSYYLSGGYEETDNDAPLSGFHQGSTALRIEAALNPVWTLGTTFRAVDSTYRNGGTSDDRFDSSLVTLYATGRMSESWTARYSLGHQQEFYDSESTSGFYNADLRAYSISTDQEFRIHDSLRLLAGGFFHRDDYQTESNYPGFFFLSSAKADSDRHGLYTAVEWDALEDLTATAALRWEDYDSHGSELTWRLGSVLRIPQSGTALRGSIGTSFRAPTYLDLYYANNYGATGNPDLESQSAIGWDLGIEQSLGSHHALEATYFKNLLDNAIDSYAYPSPVNIPGTTATEGVEFAWRSRWCDETVQTRLAWTWLRQSLKDQPRNAANASVTWNATEQAMLGIGASHLAARSWGGDDIAACTVARVFGSYQLTENVKLHARVENALDEQYELSSFYGDTTPGAGTGIYGGVTVKW